MSGGGGGSQTIGFEYYFGIHMGIGRGPVDELVQIKVGDRLAWGGSVVSSDQIQIDAPNLFGGRKAEGGVKGPLDVMMGESTQVAPSGLVSMLGGPLPGYRRMFTVFYDGMISAMNPYPKPWAFRVRRALTGWDGPVFYPEKAIIDLVGSEPPGGDSATPSTTLKRGVFGALVPSPVQTAKLTVVPPSGGTVVEVVFVEAVFGMGEYQLLVAGQDYTVAGDVVTFPPSWYGTTMRVGFTYTPAGGGGPTPVEMNFVAGNLTPPATVTIVAPEGGTFASVTYVQIRPIEIGEARETLTAGVDYTMAGNVMSFITPRWNGHTIEVGVMYSASGGGTHVVAETDIRAMNPAHIIYECLTNREWGRGLSAETSINVQSFTNAADTLYDEGFGLCLKWSRRDSIENFVQSVIDHVGAVLYTDNTTAKLTLALIRGDYVLTELPMIDAESGLLEIREATIASPGTAVNEVKVVFRDPITNKDMTARVDNLASLQASRGVFNSVTKSYPGLPTPELALRVAQRDLRASAVTPRRFQLVMDRRGWAIAPGSVIRIRDLPRGIPDMALRVGRVEKGTLLDGKITITAVQDVFSLPNAAYIGREAPQWNPPSRNACVGDYRLFELPYALVRRATSPADFAYIDADSAFLGVALEQGQPLNAGYDIAVRDAAPTSDDVPTDNAAYCGYTP